MLQTKLFGSAILFLALVIWAPFSLACNGPSSVEYLVKHLRDKPGQQLTEVVSFEQEPGLDNSQGEAALQVQIQFTRSYRYQIIDHITSDRISGQGVKDKIVELYKLPPHDPEGTIERALCPISVVIPPGQKARVTVEWTERWSEGVINEGRDGEGNRLGTYEVFLGYVEPCSMVNQENVP